MILSRNLAFEGSLPIRDENLDSFVESQALNLSENKNLINYFKERDINEIDCRVLSTIACALYLGLTDKSREISLIAGLVFDEKLAPEGEGHQWVVVDGKIIDPALSSIKDRQKHYVPLVGVNFRNSNGKFILKPQLYTLPKEF